MIHDGGIVVRRVWVWSLSTLFLAAVLIGVWVQALRAGAANRIYAVAVYGRLGRSNRDVILPVEILYTNSKEHANRVRSAIEQAIGRRAYSYGSARTNEVPGLGQSNA